MFSMQIEEADRAPPPAVDDGAASLVIRPEDLPFDGTGEDAPEPSLGDATIVFVRK